MALSQSLDRLLTPERRAGLLALAGEAVDPGRLVRDVGRELAAATGADAAWVIARRDDRRPGPEVVAATGLGDDAAGVLARSPLCARALAATDPWVQDADELADAGLLQVALAPFRAQRGTVVLLGLGRAAGGRAFDEDDAQALAGVARTVGTAIERLWLTDELADRAAREHALARAARGLNATLTPDKVLETLCAEAATSLGAEIAVVYAGQSVDFFMAVAAHGLPASFLGFVPPRGSLAHTVLEEGEARVANRSQYDAHRERSTAAFADVRSAVAVPLRRDGLVDGALVVHFEHERWVGDEDVELLLAFSELAAAAQRNADRLLAAQRAAMIDGLTGCLNHAATHERLRAELSRAERTGEPLAFVLVDLRAFRAINEEHGHLAGDAVLRAVGERLRAVVRRHDVVGRFGGDLFALVLVDASAEQAREVVARAIAELAEAPLPGGGVVGTHVGIAEWRLGEAATALLERADAGLRADKAQGRERRAGAPAPHAAPAPLLGARAERRIRKLVTAASIGARLTRLLDADAIAGVAARELGASVGADRIVVLRLDAGDLVPVAVEPLAGRGLPGRRPQDDGVAGRCLRERRAVLAVDPERHASVLAAPVHAGHQLWGAIELRAGRPGAFDAEDAGVVQTVADYVGAALRTALLYAELEASYLGAAEALAAALEAKDDYTADHARSIAKLAVAVGRRLGLTDAAVRDLRYGAIFHDIGKIAIPDAILNKPGPLTDEEFGVVKRHPIVGEQILAPIPFLAEARRIVRHDHERFDGTGYPDGLRGEEIPLGARIVLVVDAWHAMISDRPYRRGRSPQDARAELRRHAGTQFDPDIVAAMLAVLDAR